MNATITPLRLRWAVLAIVSGLAGALVAVRLDGRSPEHPGAATAGPMAALLVVVLWTVWRARARTGRPLGW